MMFSKAMKKLPFDKVVPFNENDLLLIVSPEFAFVLKSIMNDKDEYFSIKETMTKKTEENQSVFACLDFESSCSKFAEIMNSRIERFFETGKSAYIFFDQEEQIFLRRVFTANSLSCIVDIYKKNNLGKFEKISFDEMKRSLYKKIRGFINELGIVCVIRPDKFMNLVYGTYSKQGQTKNDKSFFNFRDIMARKEKEKINKVFASYPEFDVLTKSGLYSAFKVLSKKLHPDANNGKNAGFESMKESYEYLKKTSWYIRLPEKEAEGRD